MGLGIRSMRKVVGMVTSMAVGKVAGKAVAKDVVTNAMEAKSKQAEVAFEVATQDIHFVAQCMITDCTKQSVANPFRSFKRVLAVAITNNDQYF